MKRIVVAATALLATAQAHAMTWVMPWILNGSAPNEPPPTWDSFFLRLLSWLVN